MKINCIKSLPVINTEGGKKPHKHPSHPTTGSTKY